MVAFLLLAPPLFLLAPLALLLLFSGPKTLREWLWIFLATAGSLKLLFDASSTDLTSRMISTVGLLAAAAFVVVCHALPRAPTVTRGLIAIGAAGIGLAIWVAWFSLDLRAVDAAVAAQIRSSLDRLLEGAPGEQAVATRDSADSVGRLFLGLVGLQTLLGLGLAWHWYHRIAARPLPPAPNPWQAFRFNDHFVWGAIFTLAAALLPLGEPAARVANNTLVVWVGLYAIRGLAVAQTGARSWPFPGKLLLVSFAVLALPIAFGTLVTLGLADTWLDFRNRPVPAGGSDGSHSS